ncbi:MAG: prolipoprotein diacylglyceryl transferase [Sulfurovum sp.]|nr:prolipoprotein diacylglyceryl transferase [Sulfurovum sp.]
MEYFVWDIDPNILKFGALQLRWYGVLFVGSFFIGLAIMQWIYKREGKDPKVLDNFLIYIVVGVVVGARLMHCFAYEPDYYLSNPVEILYVWKGGLASHGGMLGAILALYMFSKRYKKDFVWLLSRVAIAGMVTAAFVRIGNFFNSEILGLETTKPWAVIFARVDNLPRHPVQLYEASAYLIILLILLWIYRKASFDFATKILPGVFLLLLFGARFLIEYTKTEQADYNTIVPLTVGQMLSVPFVILGLLWTLWAIFLSSKDNR